MAGAHGRFLCALAAAALAALGGCQANAGSGASCARASDCAEQLTCAGGVCRDACGDDRDCTAGASCVTYRGAGVCVPPAQPVPCLFDSDCGRLFCRTGFCVAQCAADRDCARGSCASGLCSEPVLTPDRPASDAGGDASTALDAGTAPTCPVGQVLCRTDLTCHDLRTDPSACGACGYACIAGAACESGSCVCGGAACAPVNDECASATAIPLDASGHGVVAGTTAGATTSLETCAVDDQDVFYRIHLDARSLVVAVAGPIGIGITPDLLLDGCGAPSRECGPICHSLAGSYDLAVMDAGDVFVAMTDFAGDTVRDFHLDVFVQPVDAGLARLGAGLVRIGSPPVSASGTLASGAAGGGCGVGAGDAYWIAGCDTELLFTACSAAASPAIEVTELGGAVPACGTAGSDTCGTTSRTDSTQIERGVNVYVVRVRPSAPLGAAATYTLDVTPL